MVDHNVTAIMLPMIVMGASVGVIFNIMLPEIVIIVILSSLISSMTLTTSMKWCKIIGEERAKLGPVCGRKSLKQVDVVPNE